MAHYVEPDAEDEACYLAWCTTLSPPVRAMAERFRPWSLYFLRPFGVRVVVLTFSDPPVTLTVGVSAQWNLVTGEHRIAGIRAESLEPCDLPAPHEPVGLITSLDDLAWLFTGGPPPTIH